MQRQHKWRWRRGGWRRNGAPKNPPAPVPVSETESSHAILEREAVRLLREWRDMQNAISYSQETSSRSQVQMCEADLVTFGWDTSTGDSVVPTMSRLGVDGVRERLRGRGEV